MPPEPNTFVADLIRWYLLHKRDLPWRGTHDPYKIWLSEIILQQTRVDQGLPYYIKFVERYPTVEALAFAPQEEVLRLWQGLGYYSRARNLHQCAKFITDCLNGKFPKLYSQLIKLKGIGPYTAAAIASIAFGEKVPVIDGNVFRVFSRILGIKLNIAESGSRKVFFDGAKELMQGQDPEIFNQAIMEFGALCCLPKKPKCEECVVQSSCYAFAHNQQKSLPLKEKQVKVRDRYFNYLVFYAGNKVLAHKRISGDIWEGLYDFYNIETTRLLAAKSILAKLPTQISKKITLISVSPDYKHILTHQRIYARFFTIEINDLNFAELVIKNFSLQSFSRHSLQGIPKPRLIDRFLVDEKIYIT